jgi:hypothetical protein
LPSICESGKCPNSSNAFYDKSEIAPISITVSADVLAQREMSFRAYGPRNPMKIAQSKICAARSSEVEFSLDEVEAVEMSDPERA